MLDNMIYVLDGLVAELLVVAWKCEMLLGTVLHARAAAWTETRSWFGWFGWMGLVM